MSRNTHHPPLTQTAVTEASTQMKFSKFGRASLALVASVALGLGMSACGGSTVGFLWVVGTTSTSSTSSQTNQSSQIVGFKIDQFTGNLTSVPKSPFSSAGANPANIVIRPGGRFIYVVNKGTYKSDGVTLNGDGFISVFSVGGDGTLTYQSQAVTAGATPVWGATDSSGNYFYALDQLAPAGSSYAAASLGDITVFSIAGDTGRLSVVTNQQVRDSNNLNLNYFPVGVSPTMLRVAPNSCVYVVDKNSTSDAHPTYLFPYQIGTAGQLTQTVTSQIATGASYLTSVNTGGSNGTGASVGGTYIYATDVGPTSSSGTPTTSGQIYAYTTGTNCGLNAVVNSPVANISPAQFPVWAQTEARGRFLYVLNQSNSNANNVYSSISAFTINSTNGTLTAVNDSTQPYAIGAGPTCMAEDPTNQYLYTSNSVDGNVTGKVLNASTGQLSDLARGSKFTAVTHASCLTVSGAVQ